MEVSIMIFDDPVAWEIFVDDTHCFTFAKSPAAARWNAISSGREAGYFLNRWPTPLVAKRAPQYDDSPLKGNSFRKCYSPDYMY